MKFISQKRPEFNIIHFNEIDSTNSFVLKNYNDLNNFDVIVSDIQTKGRGRNNNKWFSSSKDNIYLTFVIKPEKALFYSVAELSQVIAMALYDSTLNFYKKPIGYIVDAEELNTQYNRNLNRSNNKHNYYKMYDYLRKNLKIKWPNDLYINDKKLSGILIETVFTKNIFEVIAIGVGFNLNCKDKFLKNIHKKATSLYNEFEIKLNKNNFINFMISYLQKYYELWVNNGFSYFYNRWCKIIDIVGREVLINYKNKPKKFIVKKLLSNFNVEVVNSQNNIDDLNETTYIVNLTQVIIK